jgi:hypothetical protein
MSRNGFLFIAGFHLWIESWGENPGLKPELDKTRGGQLSKIFVDYFFDIFTLFAPQFTCFFVDLDNNKDNNFITLLPTLEIFVKNK